MIVDIFYEDKQLQCNKVTPNVTWWQSNLSMPCYNVSPVISSALNYIKDYYSAGSNEVTANQHNNKLS